MLPATERARLKSRQGVRTVGLTRMDVVNPDSGLSVKRDGTSLGESRFERRVRDARVFEGPIGNGQVHERRVALHG